MSTHLTVELPTKNRRGHPTAKQVDALVKFGVSRSDAQAMTFEAASKALDLCIRQAKEAQEALKRAAKSINIDLREYAATFTTLRRESSIELSGPCPKCGHTDCFHTQAELFFCRKCYPIGNGKPHDAIGFVMWLYDCNFQRAVEILTGVQVAQPAVKMAPAAAVREEQTDTWRIKATIIVDDAHRRLLDDGDQGAQAGRDYLENVRGLSPDTWAAYKLGYISDAPLPGTWDDDAKERVYPGQPAIAIPWFKGDRVVAVRYRFLQKHTYIDAGGKERTENKSSLYGSDFKSTMFGGQALAGNKPEHSTVLRVEGEFNAMSAWQVTKDSCFDVFSVGSQDSKPTEAMLKYLRRYRREMCWLDEAEKAGKAECGSDNAYRIKSNVNGEKQDANDLLLSGKLGGLIALHRLEATRGDRQAQEMLLSDLAYAASGWYGCDKAVAKVIAQLAKALGQEMKIIEVRPGVWRVESVTLQV